MNAQTKPTGTSANNKYRNGKQWLRLSESHRRIQKCVAFSGTPAPKTFMDFSNFSIPNVAHIMPFKDSDSVDTDRKHWEQKRVRHATKVSGWNQTEGNVYAF